MSVALLGLWLFTSCSDSPSSGGETHWLLACGNDDACGDDGVCECGVCTRRCTDNATCDETGIACADPASGAPESICGTQPPQGLCLPECTENSDCAEYGAQFECAHGHCAPGTGSIACTGPSDCPPSSSCVGNECVCDATPECMPGQTLACTPSHDMRLNCLTCECLGEPTTTLQWYVTCGDPACGGHMDRGVSHCTTEQVEGDPCSTEGEECDLVNDCNQNLICATSDPTMGPVGCPISQRAKKREIRYLTQEGAEQAYEELMSMPLATYRYRQGDDRSHLGFIIEDVAPSVAVDTDRGQVDLYGYISLAVAALKVQDERIRELEARLEAFTAEPDTAPMCGGAP